MIRLTKALLAGALLAGMISAASAQSRVEAGVLDCRGAPSTGLIVGSVQPYTCVFNPVPGAGPRQYYEGMMHRTGLDLGFGRDKAMVWTVFAPVRRVGPGDLSGSYGGVSAGASVGVGVGANVLVGGSANSVALQPVSLEVQRGLDFRAGVANFELRFRR